MLSKKIFISKLVPPQKLPSRAQAAPQAHGHGPGSLRDPCPALPSRVPHPTSPRAAPLRGGSAGGEVIPVEREPPQLFPFC